MVASAASTILDRMIDPRKPDLSPDAARALLQIAFHESERARMTDLATRSRQGQLTASEKEDLEGYMQIGLLIDLLQSKARLSLKNQPSRS